MYIRVHFLEEAEFFDTVAVVSENTDATVGIIQTIIVAQDNYIYPILCEDMYNELANQIINNTLTADNIELLSYIKPLTAWWAYYELLGVNNSKTREMGEVKGLNDSVTPASLSDSTYKRQQCYRNAFTIYYRLMKYLCNNRDRYPLIKVLQCSCGCSCTTACGKCAYGCSGGLSNYIIFI